MYVLYVYGDMDEIPRTAVVLIVAKTVGFSSTEMKLARWKPSAKIITAEARAGRKEFRPLLASAGACRPSN